MDPNSGRLFKDPQPDHRARLLPAPHATREQIRRHKVMRNERCPCGSGMKFKKCCQFKTAWQKPGGTP